MENLGADFVLLLTGGLVALATWIYQQFRSGQRVRTIIFHDIATFRDSLQLMGEFFQNLKVAIEAGTPRRFDFRFSDLSVYHQLLPQMYLLGRHEVEVIAAFYSYYSTMEGDVVGTAGTMRQWLELQDAGKEIDNRRRQAALIGVERIIKLHELLLSNTADPHPSRWSASYRDQLVVYLKERRAAIKETTGIELL